MSRDAEELRDSATDMTRAIDELDMQLTTLRTLAFDVIINTHTHTHPFNDPWSRTTRVGRYQKGKTNLDFTEARDSEWQ